MVLDIIVQFVEGNIASEDFQGHLNNNDELVSILTNNIARPSGIGEDLYSYINRYGVTTLGGKLNVTEALEKFLEESEIAFNKNTKIEKLYNLMRDIQPTWLDIPGWYMEKLLKKFEGQSEKELKNSLKFHIKQSFKYAKKAPRWLQSPQWLFENEEPLLFVGQIDIAEVRHDTSQLYIFLDVTNNKFHLVEQSM